VVVLLVVVVAGLWVLGMHFPAVTRSSVPAASSPLPRLSVAPSAIHSRQPGSRLSAVSAPRENGRPHRSGSAVPSSACTRKAR
jgi:hypothetical protein